MLILIKFAIVIVAIVTICKILRLQYTNIIHFRIPRLTKGSFLCKKYTG